MMTPKLLKLFAGAAALVFFLLLTAVAAAQKLDDVPSLRCKGETVSVGDRQFTVREACGLPDKITFVGLGSTEKWLYNFGPNSFIYYLTFRYDRLERIQTGEYGFKER